MIDLIKETRNTEDTVNRRKQIAELLMKELQNKKGGRISSILTLDLKLLFELYDSLFLGN